MDGKCVAHGSDYTLKTEDMAMPVNYHRASQRWHAIEFTGFEGHQMDALRRELDQNYEAENGLRRKPSAAAHQAKFSGTLRT